MLREDRAKRRGEERSKEEGICCSVMHMQHILYNNRLHGLFHRHHAAHQSSRIASTLNTNRWMPDDSSRAPQSGDLMRRYRQSPTLSLLDGRSRVCCPRPHLGLLHPGIINVTVPVHMYEVRRVLLPHGGPAIIARARLSEPLASALVLPAVSVLSPKAPKQEAWGMKMLWGDGQSIVLGKYTPIICRSK